MKAVGMFALWLDCLLTSCERPRLTSNTTMLNYNNFIDYPKRFNFIGSWFFTFKFEWKYVLHFKHLAMNAPHLHCHSKV